MTEEFNNTSYFHRICVESRLLVLTLMQVFVSRKLQPLTLIELFIHGLCTELHCQKQKVRLSTFRLKKEEKYEGYGGSGDERNFEVI